MAVGTVILSPGAAVLSDGSANNLAPAIQRVKSSGADPKPIFLQLAFDAAQSEYAHWSFQLPSNYASAILLRGKFKMASATSGNVIVESRVAAITDGDSTDGD